MSDIKIKNTKKPISFAKPVQEKRRAQLGSELAKPRKASLQSQLRKLEDEVKLLTSYSSDTIYRLDYRSMKYDYISPAVTRLLGFTPQEMKRINFRSLIVETRLVTDGLQKVSSFEELEEMRKSGDVGKWDADYLIRTKSGERIWVSDISFPWFDDNGKVIGSVGSLRDVSQRVAIEQKLFTDVQELSSNDALTALPSKSAFFNSMDKELKRIRRTREELSVVVFDVDGLGTVNSQFGEGAGDMLIVELAKMIKDALRETDHIARIEGGCFAVMLPDTDVKGAYFVADRVRGEVNRRSFSFGGDKRAISCSVSAGVATTNYKESLTAADMYKLADTRLYIAKNTGRNQVSIDEIVQMH